MIHPLLRCIVLFVTLTLLHSSALPIWAQATPEGEAQPEPETGLRLSWDDGYLEISGPNVPGGPVRIHYMEAYCRPGSTKRDWSETVIPHETARHSVSSDGKRLVLEDVLEDGCKFMHFIEAGEDEVSFYISAYNPTDQASDVHWAQPCMRVDTFTGSDPEDARQTQPPYIRKCFLMVDGELTRLPTEPWATEARYVPGQVYVPEGVDRADVNPRPLSQVVPSSGLTGCYSEDEKMILAIAWEDYQEVFQGVITCMHSDVRIGGLAPKERKGIDGKLYIVPADEQQLIRRVRKDFQALK
ncbi:hypothetical protein [Roseimaritima sediminicola]|uniref:hypothetical protein n=1 Tax=Roseimaritima sediminicola TaxID=2662066 RepID=UPI0012983C4C|nr:hypothetical protein [Roseimaritima sediminicola]